MNMKALRDLAVEMGEYDVGKCNCHHATQKVYNYCAKKQLLCVDNLPNQLLSDCALALKKTIGFDVATGSKSATSDSQCAGSQSRVAVMDGMYDEGRFALEDSSKPGDHIWASPAAELAHWIYAPVKTDTICLNNSMQQTIVVYVEETGEQVNIEACQGGSIRIPPDREDVTVKLYRLGLFGFISRRVRLGVERLARGAGCYTIKANADNVVYCAPSESESLSEEFEVESLQLSQQGALVQWAVVTTADAVYIVFRGTSPENLLDLPIDLSFITFDDAPHGLRVHGGMWNALHQRSNHVVNAVYERLKQEDKPVILCGHSLGGGYAILTALDLLYRGLENVSAVVTFGAPQVIVPEYSIEWCRKLDAITTLYVNSYDVVPRLPSCTNWIFDVVPNSHIVAKSFVGGAITLEANIANKLEETLGHQREVFDVYDTVGCLMFIGQGSKVARRVPSTDQAHREILSEAPRRCGPFILEHHSMSQYKSIASGLIIKTTEKAAPS
jgi:hypothetical protein